MRITGKNLTYQYPSSGETVFDSISFELAGPGFHALFGPSGVGKTTLARMIAGLVENHTGKILIQEDAKVLYTYNTERLPGWCVVGEHIERMAAREKRDQVDKVIDFFGLSSLLNSRFSKLSLGQQNRINLCRYLLQDFDILVMDESLANVDEARRGKIIGRIKEMFPEKIFLYISHNVVEVARFCGRIMILRPRGKSPRLVDVDGLDQMGGGIDDRKGLEDTMLEIVNAS